MLIFVYFFFENSKHFGFRKANPSLIFVPGFKVWKEVWKEAIHFRHFRQNRANSIENLIDSYLAKFTFRPLFTSGSI